MQQTIPFKAFWPWLTEHPDCILRAGSADSVVYDDDDYHWCFTEEDACTVLVQVIRGKRPVAELFIEPSHIAFVRMTSGERGTFNFDLVSEVQGQSQVMYYFVLSHGFEQPAGEPAKASQSSDRLH